MYLYDHTNGRIVEIDLDLNILEYIRIKYKFFRYAFPIKNQRFLGDYFAIKQYTGRIGIIDKDGERLHHFFEKLPIKEVNWKDRVKLMRLSPYSTIGMDISPDRDQVLIYFYYPTNPVEIFIYYIKGDSIKTLKYKADEKYQFPEHFLEFKSKYTTPYHYLNVYSAFFYKDNYFAFYRETSQLNEKEQKVDDFCLVFNSDGKLIQKIPLDKPVGFFYLSLDGYLLGSGIENEIEKLYIYRIKHVKL